MHEISSDTFVNGELVYDVKPYAYLQMSDVSVHLKDVLVPNGFFFVFAKAEALKAKCVFATITVRLMSK